MTTRFEVLVNGQRVCMAGINGDGVLNAMVDYVKHTDDEPRYELSIGGLGYYHPVKDRKVHASWPRPRIGVGDEITIRILPAGPFEVPKGMKGSPSASIEDPVLGQLEYYIDAWHGEIPFDFPPFQSAQIHFVATDKGPTDIQRTTFRELIERREQIWPRIAEALVRCHPEIETVEELTNRIDPHVTLHHDGKHSELELVCTVVGDPENRAYMLTIRNWEIVEIYVMD